MRHLLSVGWLSRTRARARSRGEGSRRQLRDVEKEVGQGRSKVLLHANATMLLFSPPSPAISASARPAVLHELLVQPRDVDLHVDAPTVSIHRIHPSNPPSPCHAAAAGGTRRRLGEALRGADRDGGRGAGARLTLVRLLQGLALVSVPSLGSAEPSVEDRAQSSVVARRSLLCALGRGLHSFSIVITIVLVGDRGGEGDADWRLLLTTPREARARARGRRRTRYHGTLAGDLAPTMICRRTTITTSSNTTETQRLHNHRCRVSERNTGNGSFGVMLVGVGAMGEQESGSQENLREGRRRVR